MSDQSSISMRRLVPRIFTKSPASPEISPLIRTIRRQDPKADTALVERAYATAKKWHEGQYRKSGEEYITHPVAVATILAELGIGPITIAAALLHDTVEDTDYSLDDLRAEFGDEIAMLVDGVTKLDKVTYGDAAQAETVRKMIVAMSKDIRVLVIKLADRLHNARTWGFMPAAKAKKKARETLEIYAPLAHRMGIQAMKNELEELSFAVLQPKIYSEIEHLVSERQPQRERYLNRVMGEIRGDLRDMRVRGEVVGRPKELYSIYQKMVVRGREFDEIYDLIAIRVIVDTVRDCYAVLGAIHARWTPMPGRFKDYIATPKFNLYQSLHTTVIGPDGKAVEIQIRTYEMHQRAEYGVAAHWMYKQNVNSGRQELANDGKNEMAWLKRINDWQQETSDSDEFLDSLRFEIGAKEVYVFTPQGKVIGLPQSATPVDFAYAIHTDVGHRTMGAKVNGRLVSLDTKLNTGDTVEIFTSKNPDAGPKQDWLSFVSSPRARNKIRQWFTKERRDEAIEIGKDQIAKAMRKQQWRYSADQVQEAFATVASRLRYVDVSGLFAAVGDGNVSLQSVMEKLSGELSVDSDSVEEISEPQHITGTEVTQDAVSDSGVLVRGAPDILVKIAKCCTPVPGDEIVGFITRGQGVSVHRSDCRNVTELERQPERMIDVEWAERSKALFLVNIQVEALDRAGLLSDITRVLSEYHVNILSASVHTSKARVAISKFSFQMGDTVHLDRLLAAVRHIDGIYDVYRVHNT
ncbi:RelA/SpoT family protein [Gulosibacter molinativorax]|uniref:Bifunctional (P)ppGpp synthetase/guanosine-3',5'-bis(Diphosphate) 3'-pyrophosphohydrolase n=1 Tax=Gulosibacter molinativorax TaxID=256821 RepID=A0ABT7C759_9MICO|nr:bifunctional (p)ppGpp synthetase/guanosine-3',5'-bis(diphosphate) 3'-pyrophosphohydrolase [Gulosibacter molinativorax]MDJ1371046.1 bifunctional (p)ppGpp synthetase/guanosine-3',5'-bis(diphosphate) 3'-pyrophosphohydrolase [Gulosibacter molinativorax]QUY61406.1 Bifunctional (P)ppGpp synthase/hydrolase relA [Gulosibacter molinativorax]